MIYNDLTSRDQGEIWCTQFMCEIFTRCTDIIHPQPGDNELERHQLLMNRSENSENMTTETPWCRTQFVSHGGISSTLGLDWPKGGNILLPFVVD